MASLKNIKLKIVSYKKTATVTRAMEAVSAVKMRKSQERALSGRAYAASALSILERLSGVAEAGTHPLMKERVSGKTCIVVVTSDKGLAGSLNSAVVRATEKEIARRGLTVTDVVMAAIGRRGGDYFASRGYTIRVRQENVSDGISLEDMRTLTDQVLMWHAEGEIASCIVIYTNFISTFEQEPTVRQVVPITPSMMRVLVSGIRPAKGRYAPNTGEQEARPAVYTIEPDAGSVLAELVPKLVNVAMLHTLLESKASEHSARMVAMKSATDKARDVAQELTRVFNKSRQSAITREVSEITSGIEALR